MTSRVLIYGDVSPNVIDGSAIWLASITELATRLFDETHVLLKFVPETDRLFGHLLAESSLIFHNPAEDALISKQHGHTVETAADHASQLMAAHDFDAIIVRGLDACWSFVRRASIAPKLWAYVTDLPFPPERISKNNVNRLRVISSSARRMLAQTESARSYLEALAPNAAGKTILMHPMVPDVAFTTFSDRGSQVGRPLRLVYSGKFAKEWRTLEMLELPRLLGALGVDATLTVVGSKFQKNKFDPTWHVHMRQALEAATMDPTSGVSWAGALSRSESLDVMASCEIGIGWRSPELDASLEVSTKALEYGAAGAVPLINATQEHEALYGANYQGYVACVADVSEVARVIARLTDHLESAQASARSVSTRFSMASSERRLRSALVRSGIRLDTSSMETEPVAEIERVLVAGHDLKFMGEILDDVEGNPRLELDVDRWKSLREHDAGESLQRLSGAEVVFCEWAGPNLVWYSNNVGEDQRLIARLHGFELRTGTWLSDVRWSRVDRLVVVSDHYREMALRKLPVSSEQVVVVPNMIDCSDLYRPKLPGSQFRIGVAGYVPFLKRPDRALDLLEILVSVDDRYSLHLRGRAPWEYPHVWKDSLAKQQYLDFYQRIASSDLIRERIVFEPFGPDMGSWLRNIGVMLSPSETESFHLAPAEGLASGAAAVVWDRPGAIDIFERSRVFESAETAAEGVLSIRDSAAFAAVSEEGRQFAARNWDLGVVLPTWKSLLTRSRS